MILKKLGLLHCWESLTQARKSNQCRYEYHKNHDKRFMIMKNNLFVMESPKLLISYYWV